MRRRRRAHTAMAPRVPANARDCTHSLRAVPTKPNNALVEPHARHTTLSCRLPDEVCTRAAAEGYGKPKAVPKKCL